MIAEIGSLISSSKTAYDIAKGLASVYVDDKVRERTSELIGILLSVQSDALAVNAQHQELLQKKYELEKKILEFENWSETERQYELKEIAVGVFVYAYKKTEQNPETMHWLCAKCYNERKKYPIQRRAHLPDGIHYICNNCNSNYIDHSKPLVLEDDYYEGNGIPIT
ncbi:MAG: hypothetical protein WBN77_02755 [Desulfobacterales bacterium]